MTGKITVANQSGPVAVIDIEGIIGVPEECQFSGTGERVATYETFCSAAESLKDASVTEIIVNIRSAGGDVNDALLIFEALSSLGKRITTRCYGYVASAATIIAQAAGEGCREISANSLYLIHRSVCSAEGNSGEISRALGALRQTDGRIASLYAARSGRPAEEFEELMDANNGNGRWLSPRETIENSLADRIIASFPLPEDAERQVINLGLPPIPKRKKASGRWNALLESLGLKAADPAPVGAAGAEQADVTGAEQAGAADKNNGENEDTATEEAVSVTAAPDVLPGREGFEAGVAGAVYAETISRYSNEIAILRNRVETLEAQNARLSANPTSTKPKEDPSLQDVRRSVNDSAYMEDVRRFK